MTVCIVGHGASLIGSGLGAKIDACETVIQLYPASGRDRDDFGRRCDVFAFSQLHDGEEAVAEWAMLPDAPTVCWGLATNSVPYPLDEIGGVPVLNFSATERLWTNRHHANGAVYPKEPGARKPDLSRGVRCIAIAAEAYRGRPIVLAGFDNCISGDTRDFFYANGGSSERAWIVHDYAKEAALIAQMARYYDVSISDLKQENP